MDWDALSGALGAILWIVFLVAKKRKQKEARRAERPVDVRGRRRHSRSEEVGEFRRDYEPIEPK